MRKAIRQYALDKGTPPQSLEELANAGYIGEVPEDPVTEKKDWDAVIGTAFNTSKGIIDVRSSSSVKSSEGSPYNQW